MPLLDDIGTYLVAQATAFGKLSGTTGNLAKGINLDAIAPNEMVSLYDTQGFESEQVFSTGASASIAFENPGLQILSRSTSYAVARDNANVAYQILDGFAGVLPSATGTRYLSIDAAQAPFFIGRDSNDRPLFSVNFNIRKDTT